MNLEREIQEADEARTELAKAIRAADAWSDSQRQQFDGQRVAPLEAAGVQLRAALVRANEQLKKAEKLLGEQ